MTCPERAAGCRRHSVTIEGWRVAWAGIIQCRDGHSGGHRPASAAAGHRSPLPHNRGPHPRGRAARRLGLRARARHRPGGPDRRRHHRIAVSIRRRPVERRRSARGVVAGTRRAGSDRSRKIHRALPVLAGQRIDVEGLRRSEFARVHLGSRPRRSGRGVARRLRLHDSGDLGRREPRRHGRRGVRGAPSRAVRETDHHLRRPAAGRLGHGDPAPSARARARRPSQRRRDDRHDAGATARHADLSRPRRAGHPVRQAPAASGAPAGRGVSRSSRPPIRGALSGPDLPAPERSDRSRIDGRRAGGSRGMRARQCRNDRRWRAGRHAVSVGAASGAASRAAGRGSGFVALETGIVVRARRVSSRIRIGSPICCAAPKRLASRSRPHRARVSKASASNRFARFASASSAAGPSAGACSR